MIVIDPRAGRHFSGKQIEVTPHAEEQAQKRFNARYNQARKWIIDNLRKAQYIGIIENEDSKPARLFGYHRIAFVVDIDRDCVITVYPRHESPQSIHSRIKEIVTKELRKKDRKVSALERKTKLTKADLRVELAELERRKIRTRSDAVRLACQARINAINDRLRELDEEVDREKQERSALLKGVVAYV